ncbi:MAG: hypothetical protein M1838_003938 [Thelocarpon superellum]|nr:MAG: hypothetical protein M1838_003938 [Thelocarpon superellum]
MGCYCSPVHGDVNCDEDIETMLYCAAACRCVERTNQTGPQDLGETKVKSSEAEKPATWEKMDGLYDALMRALAEDKAASSQNSDMDPKNCGSGDPNARSCPVQPPPSQPAAINFTEPQPPASPKNDASSQAEQQPPAAPAANDTQRCLGTCNSIATKCSHDATCMCGAYSTNVHLKTAIRYLGHCILRSARVRRRDIFGEDDGDGDHLYLDEGGLPLACPCNATYVSHACCNSMTGMLWEPAHRKLGELIIQS